MEHDSQTEPKKRGAVAKKSIGIALFFLGLVFILGGYVASHVFQNGVIIALGVAAGFILVIGGGELAGVE